MDTQCIINATSSNQFMESNKEVFQVSTKSYTFILVFLLGSLIVSVICRQRFKSRKKVNEPKPGKTTLPSPPALPILGSVLNLILPGADKLRVFLDWTSKYGPIFKLRLLRENFVFVNDPAMIQKILSSSNPHHLNKHRFIYDAIFVGPLVNGIVPSEVNIWAPHRKILSKSFTYTSQKNHLANMNCHTQQMVKMLLNSEEILSDATNHHFNTILHYTTIKTILYTIVGSTICTDEQIYAIQKDVEMAKQIVMYRLDRPWLLLKAIWGLHPLRHKLKQCGNFHEAFIHKVIETNKAESLSESVNNGKDKRIKCVVDDMVDAGMTNKEIATQYCSLLVAGHETNCLTQNFLFTYLALNPTHQELCRREVDGVFCGGSNDLSMDNLCNLKYVERCALETLRLVPVIPIFLRRIDEKLELDEDFQLDNGSNVMICPWTVHRNPEYYPNPEVFDPDRFLPDQCKARHPSAFIPFSAGPRNCIGWKFAIMEIKVITAFMLRNFKIYTEHSKIQDVGLDFEAGTLIAKNGFKLYFKRRTN